MKERKKSEVRSEVQLHREVLLCCKKLRNLLRKFYGRVRKKEQWEVILFQSKETAFVYFFNVFLPYFQLLLFFFLLLLLLTTTSLKKLLFHKSYIFCQLIPITNFFTKPVVLARVPGEKKPKKKNRHRVRSTTFFFILLYKLYALTPSRRNGAQWERSSLLSALRTRIQPNCQIIRSRVRECFFCKSAKVNPDFLKKLNRKPGRMSRSFVPHPYASFWASFV